MKNILISQIIKKNSHNDIICQVEKNWYDFFKNSNINLITLDASKKIKEKKISAIILQGGNDLPNFFVLGLGANNDLSVGTTLAVELLLRDRKGFQVAMDKGDDGSGQMQRKEDCDESKFNEMLKKRITFSKVT